MAWSVGLLVYVVVQFVAFLLVLVATPIDMFRFRRGSVPTNFSDQCITLWGLKVVCSSLEYEISSDRLWAPCPPRRDRFRVAQAFAVISIFVYCAAFVLGVIMLFCCRNLRWVCLTLNIVGAVTLCIVWASMAVTYSRNDGSICVSPNNAFNYGPGFVLSLLAWLLDLFNIPVLLLLPQARDSTDSGKGMESRAR